MRSRRQRRLKGVVGADVSHTPSSQQERRKFQRSVVGIPIQAVRQTAPENDPRRFVGLHVLNISRGGVGAITHEQIAEREPLVLFFPPLGPGRGRDERCQVIRCTRKDNHYHVGLAFESPWAEREEARTS